MLLFPVFFSDTKASNVVDPVLRSLGKATFDRGVDKGCFLSQIWPLGLLARVAFIVTFACTGIYFTDGSVWARVAVVFGGRGCLSRTYLCLCCASPRLNGQGQTMMGVLQLDM